MKKNKQESLLVPFWEKKNIEESNKNLRVYFFRFLFILKVIIYSFSGLMIFWSFMQSLFAPWTNYSPNPGDGMEFGYLPGIYGSGNNKFDLGSLVIGPRYHAFFEPSLVYGPFLSFFVYPIAKIFINIVYFFHTRSDFLQNTGLDVVLGMITIMFFMRFISFWSTLRSSIHTERQTYHQSNIDQISQKYSKYPITDRDAKLRKHKEIQEYNKKNGLRPLVPLENFFISTPIFLIVFKVITITRPVKFAVLFGIWDLSKTPSSMVFNNFLEGGWMYLLLCAFIIPVNFISQRTMSWYSQIRNPKVKDQILDKDSTAYKMKRVQQIMTIVFLFFTFFWSTSLAIYYFFNSLFTIFQNTIIHLFLKRMNVKRNLAKDKLKKLGLNV